VGVRVPASAFPPGGPEATARALARLDDARAIVLVEGLSDQIALETLAARSGRELVREGVVVLPIGGAQAIGRFVAQLAERKLELVGLCDRGEVDEYRRALEPAGFGFHVCVADLEDELIRAVGGPEAVVEVIAAQRDLASFRTFQKQPAWQGRRLYDQLRRYLGSADRRKIRYARVLVEALDLERVPRPLAGVLTSI
jgi:OLD-like protein